MATGKRAPRRDEPAKARRRSASPAEVAGHVANRVDEVIARKAAQLEQASERLDEKLNRKMAKLDKVSARIDDSREMLDRLSGHLGALEIWTRVEPGGRRPRFSRDEIAAAAVRIADAEGLDAVSMRRLASELGAGTMTLYHYVRTKDELLALVTDAIMGEVVLPPGEELPGSWREALTLVAERSRRAVMRHPWTLDIPDTPSVGPNSLRHFDQTLQAIAPLDISLEAKLDIVTTVDEYVFGHCLHERNVRAGEGDDLIYDDMRDYVNGLIATGDYPQLSALAAEHGLDASWARVGAYHQDGDRFERNLGRLLDGIEAALAAGTLG